MPDDGVDYGIYSNVNVHVGAGSYLSIGDLTGAAAYSIRSLDVLAGGKVELVADATLKMRTGFAIANTGSVVCNGSNEIELWGDDDATLTGMTRMSGLAALTCTTPGKTVSIGTAAADAITIPGENALTLQGSAENPLTLLPADGTGTWLLNASGSAAVDLRYVAVSNSNATVGSAVTAINSVNLGGNSGWSFSAEIVPGTVITWNGAESTDWSVAGNWDLGRTPVATDYVLVPALAGEDPDYPVLGEGALSFARITVAGGAELTLEGSTLTVTNLFTVHGDLVCTGTTTVDLTGNADFTDATVTPGASLFRINGAGDQTLDFGGVTLNNIVFEKTSGNVDFGTHGFAAASFRCFTSSAIDFTFASGETYDFALFYVNGSGYPENKVRFLASSDGTRWNLGVRDNAHALGGVVIRDCNASDRRLYAGVRCEDGLNNQNVDFSQDVAVYVGGASGDFTTAANWSSGSVPGADTIVHLAAGDGETPVLTLPAVAGARTVQGLYLGGIGGGTAGLIAKAPLTVRGDVEVRGAATLTLDAYDDNGAAPNVVSNDLHVFEGGLITHSGPASTENAKVHLSVLGNAVIDEGGAIDVSLRGYALNTGTGCSTSQGYSPSYGGWGNTVGNTGNPPYGSILRPFRWGSAGCSNGNPLGGGAIRLEVAGTLTVNGDIKSEGGTGAYYTGTGGSIWLTCGTLTGSGTINARTGIPTNPSGTYTGAGGRIAVYQTVATDFSAFPPERIFAGRNVYSAPGTVYLESADKSNGVDLYVRGTGNSTTRVTPFPMPDDGEDYTIYTNFNLHVGIATILAIGERTGAGVYPIRSLDITDNGKVELRSGVKLQTRCGVEVGSSASVTCSGSNEIELVGDDEAKLAGGSRISGLSALVCTEAGKTIRIATNAVDAVTLSGDAELRLCGEPGNPVSLLPEGGYGTWAINMAGGTEVTLRYLSVSNSNASVGAALTAINSTDLGGNTSWAFSAEIMPGTTITWQGGASDSWSLGANWDLGRVPVATDYVVVPSLSGAEPNYPVLGQDSFTFDRVTVNSGASLTLDGSTLTVTGQLNVHGTLACEGAATVYLGGSADFTDGEVSAGASLIRVTGSADQTLDFGDMSLNDLLIEKSAGDVSFGTHGFSAHIFRCVVNYGMTLAFAPAATYAFDGLVIRGSAYPSAPVELVSRTPGSSWSIQVKEGTHVLSGVAISDCTALETALCAGLVATDGGRNVNVDFVTPTALWIGGESDIFSKTSCWSSGAVPGSDTIVVISAGPGETCGATVLPGVPASVASLYVDGSMRGAAKVVVQSSLGAAGSAMVASGGTLVMDGFDDDGAAPNVISGDLTVCAGGCVTHSGPASTAAAKLHLRVDGDVTVEEGGTISATGKGYTKSNDGPGSAPLQHCIGGAYAGFGSGNSKSPYGSVLRPVDFGASVNRDLPTGGAIHLDVGGTLRIDGTVEAEGLWDNDPGQVYASGGGSVWIECGSLVGGGLISVREGFRNPTGWKSQTVGSGGRIAVYQRAAKDFSAFPKARMLTQRTEGTPCGTVLMASATLNDGMDLYIDGTLAAEQETLLPMPDDGDPMSVYKDVNLHLGARANVAVCAYDAGTKSPVSVLFRDIVLSDNSAALKLYGSTVDVRSIRHRDGRGWVRSYSASQSAGKVVLGGAEEHPGAIRWIGGLPGVIRIR